MNWKIICKSINTKVERLQNHKMVEHYFSTTRGTDITTEI